jgi:iron complex transport system substrate-binding protein
VIRHFAVLTAIILFLCSCHHAGRTAGGRFNEMSDSTYNASRFVIDDFPGYRRLVIRNPWQNTRGTLLVYYLVPRSIQLPDTISKDQVIRVPVKRMICMSTTHIAMLRALKATDVIVGISGTGLIYDSLIVDAINRGTIHDVGYDSNIDKELIVTLKPDLLMAYGVGAPDSEFLRKLGAMGVKIMYDADYLEEHPLARCKWLRLFGILTGKEEMADSIISEVSARYTRLADKVRASTVHSPDVLLGAPWEDVWYISPANSYIGRLIADAGGHYLFDDLIKPNSVPFSVEAVFKRATDADVWINPGSAGSLSDIASADSRMTRLPVYSRGDIWNNRKRITPAGGNDYWESGVVYPDILLEDIVSILHPQLLPGYEQFFYIRLK